MNKNKRKKLAAEIQQALENQEWENAEVLLHEAREMGDLNYDSRGVPLHFWERELPNLRQAALTRKAIELMQEAAARAELGNIQEARELYQEAALLGTIDPKTTERIGAALDRLSLTNSFEPEEDRKLVDSLHQLLDRVESEQSGLEMLLRSCAIPLWWDEPVLAAIRELGDGREQEILEKLEFFSFILRWSDHDVYARFVRPILLQRWQNKSDEFITINRRILDYFESGRNTASQEHIARYERWELSRLYHLLLDDPDMGVAELMTYLRQAEEDYRPTKALRYVATLQENQDYLPLEHRLPPEYHSYLTYSDGWVHTLRNRPRIAREIFEDLLTRDNLLPEIRARIQRHLGIVLVELHQWSEAVDSYDKALSYFKEQQGMNEVAYTMERLGFAYMDIAAHAYNHEDYFEADNSWMPKFWQTVSTISYVPLILYVLNNFKLGWNPTAWWRWGRDMDWVIAKYFAQAIQWFEQAEEVYEQIGDTRGLNQVRSSLGTLYLNLHYTNNSVDIFEKLELEYGDGTYQQAYVRLQLAAALFEEGQYERCEELLHKAVTAFKSLEYDLRVAQAQTLLGKVATQNNKPDSAMQVYAEALENWQAENDEMMATTVVHNMEGLATQCIYPSNENWLSKLYDSFISRIRPQPESQPISQESQALLEDAQQKVTDRVYESRFIHPLMRTFQRTSFIILCFFVPLVLWFSLHTEADTSIGATAIQSLPAQQQLNKWERFGFTIKHPEMAQIIDTSITPKFNPEFFSGITIGALLLYLVIYTAIGLFILRKIKMRDVESLQAVKLRANRQGFSEFMNGRTIRWLNWSKINVFLSNNRSIFHRPIKFFSKTVLVTDKESQTVRGYTKGYTKSIEWIQRHLPQHVQQLETGFSLSYSFLGWLALSTITLLLAFIVTIFVNKELLIEPFIFSTYAITDLYNILFLGFYIPLLYWFILQPLRGSLAYHVEHIQQLWLIACLALVLSIIRFVQFQYSLLTLNRPELLFAVTAILLGGFVLRQLYSIERAKLYSFKAIRTAIVALLSVGLALIFTVQEFASFHSLVQANNILYRIAEDDGDENRDHTSEYKEALALYKNSHGIRETAITFNSQGNVYMQLRDYKQAEEMYKDAFQKAPHMLVYQQNLALAYREWAIQINDFEQKVERFEQAIKIFSEVIQNLKAYPHRNQSDLQNKAYELRAATYSDLGLLYYALDGDKWRPALGYFDQAKADYEWLIENYSLEEKPKGYIGRGWTLRYLQSHEDINTPERRQYLEDAISDFEKALEIDQADESGWAYYAISQLEKTILGLKQVLKIDKAETDVNGLSWIHYAVRQLEERIHGFKEALKAEKTKKISYAPDAYNGLGWIHFSISQNFNIRGNCINGGFDDEQSKADYIYQIESAVAAFTNALAADPDKGNGYFFRTRAQLHHILGRCGKSYTKVGKDREAISDYHKALELDPDRIDWRYRLGRLYYTVGSNLQEEDVDDDEVYSYWETSAKIFLEMIVKNPYYNSYQGGSLEFLKFLYVDEMDRSLDEVFKDIEKQALDLGIERLKIHTILARSHTYFRNEQRTLNELQQAEPLLQTDNPAHQYLQGVIHVSLGEVEAAKSAYEHGIQQMSQITNTDIIPNIYAQAISDVLLLPITKDSDEVQLKLAGEMAVLVAEAALEAQGVNYTNRDEAWNAAESARKNKEYEIAIPRYIKALDFEPNDYNTRREFQKVLISGYGMNKTTSGIAALTATLSMFELDDAYGELFKIVESELAEDIFEVAVVALERAHSWQPDNIDTPIQLAEVHIRWLKEKHRYVDNHFKEAYRAAQVALNIEPDNEEIFNFVGQVTRQQIAYTMGVRVGWKKGYKRQNYPLFIRGSQKAVQLDPSAPRYHFNLGLAYTANGEIELARDAYQTGIEVVNLAENNYLRLSRLKESIYDLKMIKADPEEAAQQFIDMLENEKDVDDSP